MSVRQFEKPIQYYGKEKLSYREALVIRLEVTYRNYDEIISKSNMPLLFIDTFSYQYYKEEKGASKNKKVLLFHVPNWEEIKDNSPITYTLNHYNPHRNNRNKKFRKDEIKR